MKHCANRVCHMRRRGGGVKSATTGVVETFDTQTSGHAAPDLGGPQRQRHDRDPQRSRHLGGRETVRSMSPEGQHLSLPTVASRWISRPHVGRSNAAPPGRGRQCFAAARSRRSRHVRKISAEDQHEEAGQDIEGKADREEGEAAHAGAQNIKHPANRPLISDDGTHLGRSAGPRLDLDARRRMPGPGPVITPSAGRPTRSARPITALSMPGSALPRLPASSRHVRRQPLGIVPVTRSTAASTPNVCATSSATASPRDRRCR